MKHLNNKQLKRTGREISRGLLANGETAVTIAEGALDALALFLTQYRAGTPISAEDLATIDAVMPDARERLAAVSRELAAMRDRLR